jgi:hypothetical protein
MTLALSQKPFFVALIGVAVVPGISLAAAQEAPARYLGTPYKGKAASLPGVVQAEEYDIAPEAVDGISFNYNGGATKGPVRTTPDSVGLARFGDGHVTTTGEKEASDQAYAGWTHDGEWLKYSVHVDETGVYRVGGQFSAADKGGLLSFTFTPSDPAGTVTTGPVEIPTTAGYQPNVEVYHVWEKVDGLAEISLPKGDYVMTVKIEKNAGLNLDYFTVTKKP